ncbi:envelope glycoprotein G [Macacine alphaherpesvirus 3]|uniref:Envelope glycoprotein G n=3 Tax=Simplexvirus TaxID=10294 RepID=A0A1X9WFG2_9ALPH|nr:envelope glycoprotein G [Macacine alphaherpesvirus 1]ARS01850.1 envelope glycoprotein G [Macacine alphaherpesvirus 3]
MRRLLPRPPLLAAALCLCVCLRPAGAGPRPPAPAAAAHCYAVPRLDDAGPTGPAPPVADVERHPVVRHRSLARSYPGGGLALLAPPIRRFRGIDGGAYAARVAYYLVDSGGCRRPVALRWYAGCRGGAAPSPQTCGRYSHTYQNGSPPTAHALVNASLLVPVVGSRAAAYEYEILVGDRLHVGRLTVSAAPDEPGATPCRPVAPAVPLWRGIPAAWLAAANPLFDGPEARRCASPSAPAEPQDMAYVSAAPQSLLVGLAGYLFARGERGRPGEPPETGTPAPRAERSFPRRPARSLLSVTTEGAEASSAPPTSPAPSTAAPAPTQTQPTTRTSVAPSAAGNHTGDAGASPSAESQAPSASPETGDATPAPNAGSDAANDTAAGENGTGGVPGSASPTPATASPATTASAAKDTEAAGTAPVPSGDAAPQSPTEAAPRDPFTPRLEVLTPPPPEAGGGTEGGAGEEDGDGDGDDEEGAGDGELPPPERHPGATDETGNAPGPRPGGSNPRRDPAPPRRPASTLPPPSLGPLTLRPPSPPTEPRPPPPAEPPHTPMFPFLTASPGLDFLFLLSLAAHVLAFVIITVMVLRPCRPRPQTPSGHRVRYTRLATSHA